MYGNGAEIIDWANWGRIDDNDGNTKHVIDIARNLAKVKQHETGLVEDKSHLEILIRIRILVRRALL